jgi:endogenous inhibitor of DNA gyrase (YacG/DUF329 family)
VLTVLQIWEWFYELGRLHVPSHQLVDHLRICGGTKQLNPYISANWTQSLPNLPVPVENQSALYPAENVSAKSAPELSLIAQKNSHITSSVEIQAKHSSVAEVNQLILPVQFQNALNQPPEMESEDIIERVPCPECNRKFAPDAINRHIPACAKANSRKRAVFNTQAKRVQGTEMEKFIRPSQSKDELRPAKKEQEPRKKIPEEEPPVPTPRRQMAAGPPRTPCPSCGRGFSEDAAARHIPWCKLQQAKTNRSFGNGNPSGNGSAIPDDLLNRRIKYQPPPIVGVKKKVPETAATAGGCIFCSGCGNRFPTQGAKFCFECGSRRT